MIGLVGGLLILMKIFGMLMLISLECLAVRIASNEGMIFEKLDNWLNDNLKSWIYKPLWGCVYCMASIHGSLLFVTVGVHVIGLDWALWPLICICAIPVNGFVALSFDVTKNKTEEVYEHNED